MAKVGPNQPKSSLNNIIIGGTKRNDLYSAGKKTIQLISIIFLIFTSLVVRQFKLDLIINWQNIIFWVLIMILAISKLTDYASTIIVLRDPSCVELHPDSDLYSISKIKKAHFLEIFSLAIKGFVLNLISYNYLGNALIIIEILIGFTATLSNLTTQ